MVEQGFQLTLTSSIPGILSRVSPFARARKLIIRGAIRKSCHKAGGANLATYKTGTETGALLVHREVGSEHGRSMAELKASRRGKENSRAAKGSGRELTEEPGRLDSREEGKQLGIGGRAGLGKGQVEGRLIYSYLSIMKRGPSASLSYPCTASWRVREVV